MAVVLFLNSPAIQPCTPEGPQASVGEGALEFGGVCEIRPSATPHGRNA